MAPTKDSIATIKHELSRLSDWFASINDAAEAGFDIAPYQEDLRRVKERLELIGRRLDRMRGRKSRDRE